MAGNVTRREKNVRRVKLIQAYISGTHAVRALAKQVGCNARTVRKDFVFIKSRGGRFLNRPDIAARFHETDTGLLQDLERVNELIEEISKVPGEMRALAKLIGNKLEIHKQRARLYKPFFEHEQGTMKSDFLEQTP